MGEILLSAVIFFVSFRRPPRGPNSARSISFGPLIYEPEFAVSSSVTNNSASET